MYQHITDSKVIAVDTETSGLNPRKDKIVGWSISGDEGIGFYIPTLVWDFSKEELVLQTIDGTSTETISKNLFEALKGKQLVFHNASFDCQFIKNYYGIDLIEDIWVDTSVLVHTVHEEGAFGYGNPFGLKYIAIMNQEGVLQEITLGLSIIGSLKSLYDGTNYPFAIISASITKFKVDHEGLVYLVTQSSTPTAAKGALYLDTNHDLFIGQE